MCLGLSLSLCFSCVCAWSAVIKLYRVIYVIDFRCEENIQSFNLNSIEAEKNMYILIIVCKTRPGPGYRGRFNQKKNTILWIAYKTFHWNEFNWNGQWWLQLLPLLLYIDWNCNVTKFINDINRSNRYTKSTIHFDWKDKMVFDWEKKREKILNRYLCDYYYYFKLRSSRPITKIILHNLHCSLSFSGYFS